MYAAQASASLFDVMHAEVLSSRQDQGRAIARPVPQLPVYSQIISLLWQMLYAHHSHCLEITVSEQRL